MKTYAGRSSSSYSPASTPARRMQAIARVTEMADAQRALDGLRSNPVAFAAACGITCDDWQADVLRSNAPRIAILASRQSGKSLIAAVLSLYQAVYVPGSLILILSPTLRQSQESFGKVRELLAGLSLTSELQVPADGESALGLRLSNRSRVVALPATEKTVRGYSNVALMVLDEAARLEDALYASVRPMLAVSNGRLVALSTPYGKRGWWWETVWRDDLVATDSTWLRVTRTAEQCPRISAEFLAEEQRTMGWWWYSQEYENAWNDAQTAVFRSEDVERVFAEDYAVWDLDGTGDGSGFIQPQGADVRRSAGVAAPRTTNATQRHRAIGAAISGAAEGDADASEQWDVPSAVTSATGADLFAQSYEGRKQAYERALLNAQYRP